MHLTNMHPQMILFCLQQQQLGTKRPNFPYGGRGQVIGGQWTKPAAAGRVTLFITMRLMLRYTIVIYGKGRTHTNCTLEWALTLFY